MAAVEHAVQKASASTDIEYDERHDTERFADTEQVRFGTEDVGEREAYIDLWQGDLAVSAALALIEHGPGRDHLHTK